MKVNVVYAHPAADSYHASLHQRLVRTLDARGDGKRPLPASGSRSYPRDS